MGQILAYPDAMAEKPASRPIAKAIRHPSGNGFAGQFALPGLVPVYVAEGGLTKRYPTGEEAEVAALRAMFLLLVSRTTDARKAGGYQRLTGAAFALLLRNAETTPTEFAEIYGVPQSRVMGWIDGAQDIPHSAHVLSRLLAHQTTYNIARAITNQARSGKEKAMDVQVKSDAALWQERMGYNGKQVSLAAEQLGMSGRQFMRKRDGEAELTLSDRLAMAALRAGLPPWSPETDLELLYMAQIRELVADFSAAKDKS